MATENQQGVDPNILIVFFAIVFLIWAIGFIIQWATSDIKQYKNIFHYRYYSCHWYDEAFIKTIDIVFCIIISSLILFYISKYLVGLMN
jgi:hypothetical protein